MPAFSPKDPYLLKVFRGSFWPFGGLFPRPVFLKLLVFLEFGRDAAGFNNSAACTHAPTTFTFLAMALHLGAEVLDLRHRSGLWTLTQPPGSKSGAWEKRWVQHQETQNSCPLSTRTRTVSGRRSKPAPTSRRKHGYRSIPIRDRQKHVQ